MSSTAMVKNKLFAAARFRLSRAHPIHKLFGRSSSLFFIAATEMATPFIRMMILSRLLDLRELGFASALTATCGMFELASDISVYRFVFAQPRENYEEALASAHALSILRGLLIGALAVLSAPLIAYSLSLSANWESFAFVGLVILIKSFEHLAPRVAERDYQYKTQFKVTLVSNGLSLVLMFGAVALTHDHRALLMSLLGQALGLAIASRLLSATPYRVAFRSPLLRQAFRYSCPLMLNGLGLALSSQVDRIVVGVFLGLPALGVYSIVLLATVVPMSLVFRIFGTLNLAAFYNSPDAEALAQRIRLAATIWPIVATLYALGVAFLANIVVPAVFGAQFTLSRWGLAILSAGLFFRILRVEPFTSYWLNNGSTGRLALVTLSTGASLAFATLFMLYQHTFEAVLAGRLLGEMFSLGVSFLLARGAIQFGFSLWVGVLTMASACAAIVMTSAGFDLRFSLIALAGYGAFVLAWVSISLFPLFRTYFVARRRRA